MTSCRVASCCSKESLSWLCSFRASFATLLGLQELSFYILVSFPSTITATRHQMTSQQAPKHGIVEQVFLFTPLAFLTQLPLHRLVLMSQTQAELVRLQRLNSLLAGSVGGVGDALRRVGHSEGYIGLFRGSALTLLESAILLPMSAAIRLPLTSYAVNTMAGMSLQQQSMRDRIAANLTISGILSSAHALTVHPIEYARTQLIADLGVMTAENKSSSVTASNTAAASQATSSGSKPTTKSSALYVTHRFKDARDVLRRSYAARGIRGPYAGFGPHLVITSMLSISALPATLHEDFKTRGALFAMWAGFTVASYPFQVMMRRMILQSLEPDRYRNMFQCYSYIVRNEGYKGLYRGFSAHLVLGVVAIGLISGAFNVPSYIGGHYT